MTSNRNVKQYKKNLYQSNKYIEMCIKIYMYICKQENKQIYRNGHRKIFI